MVLGGDEANCNSPNPVGARDRNSPALPAMRPRRNHGENCIAVSRRGQSAFTMLPLRGSNNPRLSLLTTGGWQIGSNGMTKRPVATGTEARAGTKEGVVRYILMASLVLVVLLFIVAYELSS